MSPFPLRSYGAWLIKVGDLRAINISPLNEAMNLAAKVRIQRCS